MKDYLSLNGLTYFLDKLIKKFSVIGHTHTKDEISDLQEVTAIATDDDNGNVTLVCTSASTTYNDRLNALEAAINDNDILVANNASN